VLDDVAMKTPTMAELDEVVDAYFHTFDMLAALPGVRIERASRGTCLVASGILTPTTNGVFCPRRTAAVDEVAALAATMRGLGVPWSIQTRGEPEPGVLEVAAQHGLTERFDVPLMLIGEADLVTRSRAASESKAVVHVVDADRRADFLRVLCEGFDMPFEHLGPLALPELLESPGLTCYLVEADAEPVACGSALSSRGHVCIANIATLAEHRGHGYGRLVTEAAVSEGFAGGAHTAYLMASPDGLPLYESMGFRTVEHWTYLTAGA
jgi:GNAT superfamily N-acetyltransferase